MQFNKNWLNIPLVIRCAVEYFQMCREHDKQEREWKREKREAEKNKTSPGMRRNTK